MVRVALVGSMMELPRSFVRKERVVKLLPMAERKARSVFGTLPPRVMRAVSSGDFPKTMEWAPSPPHPDWAGGGLIAVIDGHAESELDSFGEIGKSKG